MTLNKSDLAKFIELDADAVKKILFKPQTESEKALGEIIWSTIPTDDILNMKHYEGLAHNVAKELSQYQNVDEFERYLTALKMIVIKREPGIVEVF